MILIHSTPPRPLALQEGHLKPQWTGNEYKNIEKVFLGIISSAIPDEPVRATHAVLDFIYLGQYLSHSTVTLAHMQDALNRYHMVSLMKVCTINL